MGFCDCELRQSPCSDAMELDRLQKCKDNCTESDIFLHFSKIHFPIRQRHTNTRVIRKLIRCPMHVVSAVCRQICHFCCAPSSSFALLSSGGCSTNSLRIEKCHTCECIHFMPFRSLSVSHMSRMPMLCAPDEAPHLCVKLRPFCLAARTLVSDHHQANNEFSKEKKWNTKWCDVAFFHLRFSVRFRRRRLFVFDDTHTRARSFIS